MSGVINWYIFFRLDESMLVYLCVWSLLFNF